MLTFADAVNNEARLVGDHLGVGVSGRVITQIHCFD